MISQVRLEYTTYDEYVNVHIIWFLKSTLYWSTPISTYFILLLNSGWVNFPLLYSPFLPKK